MDETTFQMYDRIVSTLFNDGVVKFGRILTLFVSTRKLCKKYPDYTQRLWCIYHRTVASLNFPNEECRIFSWRRPDMFKWGFFSVVNIESCNLIKNLHFTCWLFKFYSLWCVHWAWHCLFWWQLNGFHN